MIYSASNGNEAIVKLLVEKGANLEVVSKVIFCSYWTVSLLIIFRHNIVECDCEFFCHYLTEIVVSVFAMFV